MRKKYTKKTKFKNKTVLKSICLLIALIICIVTVKLCTDMLMASETEENSTSKYVDTDTVTWATSYTQDSEGNVTYDTDSDGNVIKVPVPAGYSASQVPGETSVNTGFVIYEGEIDWSLITDLDSYLPTETASSASTTSLDEEEVTEVDDDENTETETIDINENTETTVGASIASPQSEETEEDTNTEVDENSETDAENIENDDIYTENENTDEIDGNTETTVGASIASPQEEEIGDEDNSGIATIAEDEETDTTMTVFELQSSVNQYVWVPIYDISEIYGVDSDGIYHGKLYSYSTSGRSALNWTEIDGIMSITDSTSYREPDVVSSVTAYDIESRLEYYSDGMRRYDLLAKEMQEGFYKMIKSVGEYEGFYIGRYETGGLSSTAVVQKMNSSIKGVAWYVMYEQCKSLGEENNAVTTSMIWGSLWDATLEWLVDSGATTSDGTTITYSLLRTSTTWGNYYDSMFDYINTSGETVTKETSTRTQIPAGSTDYTKVNNIYDLAGNVFESSLETYSTGVRISHGGWYYHNGNNGVCHVNLNDYPTAVANYCGCRAVLYLKVGD